MVSAIAQLNCLHWQYTGEMLPYVVVRCSWRYASGAPFVAVLTAYSMALIDGSSAVKVVLIQCAANHFLAPLP